mmetsp:Transcript_23202/g.32388  ORF Transcript_23202/g.32388 Transcript_23202/m.32388 type:complete len:467 (-) Transcript_23202:100-1500(-)|eukprot:CAMPEP_0168551834 /NCGR_PEP_ID=MMETSP0413-20121227/6393_1 /TAXON_ID=136452 /ORGANISM="Filamoeba nolandi, Strain NC-AS-23-1" /LENGTH=466 /DNA_ID=CAMNT_0008582405 /DNA_START=93 /DNA_END=1493 /DNA_ORIENTATION=-
MPSLSSLWKELTVPPKSSNYNAALTGLRSVAFLWVSMLHSFIFYEMTIGLEYSKRILEFTSHPLISIILSGTYGVEIFLLLSGFLLAQDLWNQFNANGSVNIVSTLKQRLIRLYPTFFVMELFQMMSPTISCPCIPELLFIQTYAAGCLPAVWSTIVDFKSWLILVVIFSMMTRLKEPTKVRKGSILFGLVLIVMWILIRLNRAWTEQYEPNPKLLYLPDLLDVLKQAYPEAPWKLGDFKSVEAESHRIVLYHWVDTFYFNFFTKFGSEVAGFVLYLLLTPPKQFSRKETQLPSFQNFLIKFHLPITVLSVILSAFLVTIVVYPSNLAYINLPKPARLIYMALHRPLFVLITCILISFITIPHQTNLFLSVIKKILSWDVWYFFSKISYAGYYWSTPSSGIVALGVLPLNLESATSLNVQYFTALGANFCLLIPMSVVTHLLVERSATNWLRSKPSRLDQKEIKTN